MLPNVFMLLKEYSIYMSTRETSNFTAKKIIAKKGKKEGW